MSTAECLRAFVVRGSNDDEPLVVQPVVGQRVLEDIIEVDADGDSVQWLIDHHVFIPECRGCRTAGLRNY